MDDDFFDDDFDVEDAAVVGGFFGMVEEEEEEEKKRRRKLEKEMLGEGATEHPMMTMRIFDKQFKWGLRLTLSHEVIGIGLNGLFPA
ncbi:MAG: hypothetical protein IMF11_00720 [Proteobacteria bacterium]|nr:hypothetical protein [Pseudomonadota bacterium]